MSERISKLLGQFNVDQSVIYLNDAREAMERAFDLVSKVYWKAVQLDSHKVAREASVIRNAINERQKAVFDLMRYMNGEIDSLED